MPVVLEAFRDQPEKAFEAGETVLAQGERTGLLLVLIEGSVEVVKDDVKVAMTSESGAVFGDLSALLDAPHTASVRTVKPSRFYVISDARAFLQQSPDVCLHVCVLLAQRLDALNKYLVDVKHQFQGHDHIGILDGVLDLLMHRHPRQRVPPSDSTVRSTEVAD